MNVNFYNIQKRQNSTKLPTGGGVVNCTLKDRTSRLNPEIRLVWSGSSAPTYNYAYINDFRRYYWVTDWIYEDRQWTARLRVDVLASYKAQIGASNKYVLRAASDYDPEAIESLYPATAEYKAEGTLYGTSLGWDVYGDGGGSFVVTCVGNNNPVGVDSAVCMFSTNGTGVQTLISNQLNAIEGAANSAAATDIKEAILNLLRLPGRFTTDLSQYIKNIMWFPFEFAVGLPSNIQLGMYNCLQTGRPLTNPVKIFTSSIDLSSIPGSGEPWEYMAPYGVYNLEIQPFGIIPLPASEIVLGSALNVGVRVDAASGLGLLEVEIARGLQSLRRIAARTAQIGVAIPYGGTAPDYAGAITGGASVIASAASFASGESSGASLLASIGSAFASASPNGYAFGTSGGGAALIGAVNLHYAVFDHVATDPAENGRPLAAPRQINTLSGYIKCRDGEIAGSQNATSEELAEIASFLTGGFFYE